ncbi:MAG: GH3 auxin-responsive promoter family protein, partial [Flavobacteriales bacterium]
GIQDELNISDLLLMLDYGIFYEFIPLDGTDERIIPLSEVKTGINYAMVITTNAGLWRYKIGDTVRFTSVNPYRIRVSGRVKHFINAFGEELMVDNAEQGLNIACRKTGARIRDYTAGPVYMGDKNSGCHEWLIEFDQQPESPEYFTEVLDNALKSLNSDYEAKRYKDIALTKPKVHIMPAGTFYNWLKHKNKLGGQNKVPRLANNRHYLDEILRFAGQENGQTHTA